MSLEELLTKNIAALEANTAAISAQTEFMKSMSKAGGGAATASTTKATGTTKPAATTKATTKPAAPAGPTTAEVAERVGNFLKTGDKDTRAANKEAVGKIVAHFGAERFTAIPAENMAEALGYIEDLEEGRTPEIFADEGEDGGEEEEESLV